MASLAENKYKKRTNIINAAFELFTSKSVADTAIDDVVRLAGVAKGTFYLYFRDKYDLLDQIVMYRAEDIIVSAYTELRKKAENTAMSAHQQFVFMSDRIINYLSKNKKVTALIDHRISRCFSENGYSENGKLFEAKEYLTSLITDLMYSAEEAQKRLFVIADMIVSVSCDAILGEKPFRIEEITPTLHDILKAILTEVKPVDK